MVSEKEAEARFQASSRRLIMNRALGLLSAAGIGAATMYLFDPDRGKRRRALVRNKAEHVTRIATTAAGKTRRDVRNHLLGALAECESLFRSEEVSDDILEARVRSKLGRVVSHPHGIEVKAVEGVVNLSGPILADEVLPLLDTVIAMYGVNNIDNRLDIHERADVPALQGGRKRQAKRVNWSPTTRLLATATGGALTIYGLKRRGFLGSTLSSLGMAVVTRALTNLDARRLVGLDGTVRGSDTDKTINHGIAA
jgi:hypothetical protein